MTVDAGRLPVSVVVPTIGRAALLAKCLDSITRCVPAPAEIVVVDQSGDPDVRNIVETLEDAGVRLVVLDVKNKSLALNLGLTEARHEVVLVTDDDCTVHPSWVGVAYAHLAGSPGSIVTGRVLGEGESAAITSTVDETSPHDFTGQVEYGALYGGNMACGRRAVLALGGFDERFEAAEDNDLCYRWLRAGRHLLYEPRLLVWHHAWRTPAELERQLRAYARGQGTLYAKHLRAGDLRIARFLVRDLYRGARGALAGVVKGRSEWPDHRTGLLGGVLTGLASGLRPSTGKTQDPRGP